MSIVPIFSGDERGTKCYHLFLIPILYINIQKKLFKNYRALYKMI